MSDSSHRKSSIRESSNRESSIRESSNRESSSRESSNRRSSNRQSSSRESSNRRSSLPMLKLPERQMKIMYINIILEKKNIYTRLLNALKEIYPILNKEYNIIKKNIDDLETKKTEKNRKIEEIEEIEQTTGEDWHKQLNLLTDERQDISSKIRNLEEARDVDGINIKFSIVCNAIRNLEIFLKLVREIKYEEYPLQGIKKFYESELEDIITELEDIITELEDIITKYRTRKVLHKSKRKGLHEKIWKKRRSVTDILKTTPVLTTKTRNSSYNGEYSMKKVIDWYTKTTKLPLKVGGNNTNSKKKIKKTRKRCKYIKICNKKVIKKL